MKRFSFFIILFFTANLFAEDVIINGKKLVIPKIGYNVSGITNADPPVVTFAGGSELVTGTLDIGSYYLITATEVDHFYAGCNVTDRFLADAETALDGNNKVKKLHDYSENDVITISGVASDEGIGAELVVDWDMEDDPENNYSSTNTILANEAVTVYAGAQAVKATLTSDYGTFYQNMSVTAGDWMIASGYITNDAGDQSQIRVFDVSNANTLYATDMQDNSANWVKASYVFQVPSGCSTIRLVVRGRYSTDVIYGDNLSLKQILPVQAPPYRITAIDSEGKITLGNEDFSWMDSAITTCKTFKHERSNYEKVNF